jgi:hypothetical protein
MGPFNTEGDRSKHVGAKNAAVAREVDVSAHDSNVIEIAISFGER